MQASLYLDNMILRDNTKSTNGGAIFAVASTIQVQRSQIINTNVVGGPSSILLGADGNTEPSFGFFRQTR